MKRYLYKIITILIIFVMISNILCPVIYAAESEDEKLDKTWEQSLGGRFLDGFIGISNWIIRAPLGAIAMAVQVLFSALGGFDSGIITVEDIIFSRTSSTGELTGSSLLNINFFDLNSTGNSTIQTLRTNIAQWYYVLRNLAIVLSLIVLIYVGIRMAISSVAEEKAKYKKMLTDWLVSFALIFLLHYFIIIVLELNNQLVTLLWNMKDNVASASDYMGVLAGQVFSPSFIKGWTSLLVYLLLLGVTVALFVQYLLRLFTIGFLIVIAPLITVTYSIDKMGNGKSEALDTWMKEFSYNVLIQPFHCIIYLVFVTSALDTINTGMYSGIIFSVGSILFIKSAENIVRKIFGFEKAGSLGSTAAAGMLAANAVNNIKKAKKPATKAKEKASGKSSSSGSNKVESSRNAKKNMNAATDKNSNSSTNAGSGAGAEKTSSTGTTDKSGGTAGTTSGTNSTSQESGETPKKNIAARAGSFMLKQAGNQAKWALGHSGAIIGGIIGLGATGDIGTAIAVGGLGDMATKGIAGAGKKISGYAQAKAQGYKAKKGTKAQAESKKSLSEQYRNARENLNNAIEDYENDSSDKPDDAINSEIEDYMNGNSKNQNIPTANQAKLQSAMAELEGVYEKMGKDNAKELATNDALDMHNKINDSVLNAANKLKNASNATYTTEQISELTNQITRDIDQMANKNEKYFSSDSFKGLSKVERDYAKEVYKTKSVMETISKTKGQEAKRTHEQVNNNIVKGVQRRIEDGTVKLDKE